MLVAQEAQNRSERKVRRTLSAVHVSCAGPPCTHYGLVLRFWRGILKLQMPSFQVKTSVFSYPMGYLFSCIPPKVLHQNLMAIWWCRMFHKRCIFSEKVYFRQTKHEYCKNILLQLLMFLEASSHFHSCGGGGIRLTSGQDAEAGSPQFSVFAICIRATGFDKEKNVISKSFWISEIYIYDRIISLYPQRSVWALLGTVPPLYILNFALLLVMFSFSVTPVCY